MSILPRRSVVAAIAAASFVVGAGRDGQAQGLGTRPLRIIVSSAPGGTVDLVVRRVARAMEAKLGQPITVENKAGADTLLATRFVKDAKPDGATILATSNTIVSQTLVKAEPGYDMQDFVGIGTMGRAPWMMVAGPNQTFSTVAEFVAQAKADPRAVSFASGGVGTTPYLAAEEFLQREGLDILHVAYKGNAAAFPDVISGRVTMMFDAVGSAAGKVRGGQMKALGVSSDERLPSFPDLPTIAEQGVPGFTSYVYIMLLAPAGVPAERVHAISDAMGAASRESREALEADGVTVFTTSPEEMAELLAQETASMTALAAKLKLDKQ